MCQTAIFVDALVTWLPETAREACVSSNGVKVCIGLCDALPLRVCCLVVGSVSYLASRFSLAECLLA